MDEVISALDNWIDVKIANALEVEKTERNLDNWSRARENIARNEFFVALRSAIGEKA